MEPPREGSVACPRAWLAAGIHGWNIVITWHKQTDTCPVPRLVVIYIDDIQAWLSFFFLSSWWCGETLWSSLWNACLSYTFWLISSQFIFNWCLSKQNEYILVEKPTHLLRPINNNILSPDLFIYINCTNINTGMNVIWNEWNISKSRGTFVKLKGLHGCVPFCFYPLCFYEAVEADCLGVIR